MNTEPVETLVERVREALWMDGQPELVYTSALASANQPALAALTELERELLILRRERDVARERLEAAERERDKFKSLSEDTATHDRLRRAAEARVAALEEALRPFAEGKHVDKAGMDIARAALAKKENK